MIVARPRKPALEKVTMMAVMLITITPMTSDLTKAVLAPRRQAMLNGSNRLSMSARSFGFELIAASYAMMRVTTSESRMKLPVA